MTTLLIYFLVAFIIMTTTYSVLDVDTIQDYVVWIVTGTLLSAAILILGTAAYFLIV